MILLIQENYVFIEDEIPSDTVVIVKEGLDGNGNLVKIHLNQDSLSNIKWNNANKYLTDYARQTNLQFVHCLW